ncbi:S26 family signal peptidase [Candidatus Phytoplasma fraxini]|uniref:Signal peptidase I n=1 Tax=Ash yellows phytoplasma TaxID=35780 RepID=A0ABZ2UC30_ASHYP
MSRNIKNIKKIIYFFLSTILFLINSVLNIFTLFLFCHFISKLFLPPLKNIAIFKFDVCRVVSGSMEPTIMTYDYVLVKYLSPYDKPKLKGVKTEGFQNSDIVIFQDDSKPVPIIHRVIENLIESNKIKTRGDANTADDAPIPYDRVLAKYVCKWTFFHIIWIIIICTLFICFMNYIRTLFSE